MAEISTLLNAHSGIVALVGLLVAILAFAVPLIRAKTIEKRADLREDIANPVSRARLATACAQTSAAAYDDAVDRLLDWTERTFGTRREIGKTFGRCVQIAVRYPVVALVLGWLFLDVGTLGGVEIFPSGLPLWRRTIATAALILLGIFFFRHRIELMQISPSVDHIVKSSNSETSILSGSTLVTILVGAAVIASAGGVVSAITAIDDGTGATFIAVLVAASGVGAASVIVVAAGAVVVGVAVTIALDLGDVEYMKITVYVMFLVLLPFLNAIADFVSLYASRYFLEQLRLRAKGARFPLRLILVEIVVDIIVALACLAGLLLSLTWVLDQWAAFFPDTLTFNWRAYRNAILAGDYSQIHMVALLGITTLVPTLVHVFVGLAAVFEQRGRLRANCAERLWALGDQTTVAPDISRDIADQIIQGDKRGTVWAFVCTTAFMGCLCVAVWLGFLRLIAP